MEMTEKESVNLKIDEDRSEEQKGEKKIKQTNEQESQRLWVQHSYNQSPTGGVRDWCRKKNKFEDIAERFSILVKDIKLQIQEIQ